MDFQPSFSGSIHFSEDRDEDSLDIRDITHQTIYMRIGLPWQGSWYLKPDTWHIYSSVSAEAQTSSERRRYSLTTQRTDYSERKTYGYEVIAGAGAGFGKVRDGQSVFAVIRILDRLREDSLLVRDATNEEVIGLAQMYSRRPRYLALFDYPEKHFFGDLIETLDSLGLVDGNSLDANAILNVADVRLESLLPRLFGWEIQAGLEHSSYQWTWAGTRQPQFERGSTDFLLVKVEYGYDLSLSTHFYAIARRKVSISPRIRKQAVTEASCSVLYELTDRIESSLTYAYGMKDETDLPFAGPRTSHLLSGSFRFYLENRVTLTVQAQYGHTINDSYWRENNHNRTSLGASFGLTYRLF